MRIEKIGSATLYLGDCREILPTLGRVDAIVTDPPYGIGISANPVRQMHEALDWDASPIDSETIQLLLDSSDHAIIWGGKYFDLPPSQRFLVWDKMQPQNFSLAMCEQAWTNLKGPAKMFRQSVTSYKKSHPTQKSVELMSWCLDFVKDAKAICDPFMGSGTTGVAALRAGRNFIGIEREPQYFEIACSRLRGAEMQASIFSDEPPPPKPIMEQTSIFG